jgi:hypothetical protein
MAEPICPLCEHEGLNTNVREFRLCEQHADAPMYFHEPVIDLKGEDVLRVLDAAGSGWVRDLTPKS